MGTEGRAVGHQMSLWPQTSVVNWHYLKAMASQLQYSCLETPMGRGAWWVAVHGVAKSWTRLSDFIFTFHSHALEKEMTTHSSVLAWRIPGTGEPGGLLSMGSHRVGHNWSDLAAAAAGNVNIASLCSICFLFFFFQCWFFVYFSLWICASWGNLP